MDTFASKKRIVIVGGGFGGIATARHLERLFQRRPDVEIVLVSRDNFLLITPLLFELFSGALDLRSCSFPVRAALRATRFVEAAVQGLDLERRQVRLVSSGKRNELSYDALVLALGSKTNRDMIPGSEHAFTFKTLADALLLRNHVIERFERADTETDAQRRAQLLTFVVVGGGLVGTELLGELTAFVDGIAPNYEHVDRGEVRFLLLHSGDRIMPEIDPTLASYGARVLIQRQGVDLRTKTRVRAIEPGKVHLASETIAADTVVLAAGNIPNPIVAGLQVDKDKNGRVVVEPTLRCRSYPEVWALGDCASIPGPDGKPYPSLAQHALRAAQVLAENIAAALDHRPLEPFIYDTAGMMGSLGLSKGFGQLLKVRLFGFPAWFIRRTYYLLQTPGRARKLRSVIDCLFALLVRPDTVKVSLDSETESLLREVALDEAIAEYETGKLTSEVSMI
jgi:NADH dehydrogenase